MQKKVYTVVVPFHITVCYSQHPLSQIMDLEARLAQALEEVLHAHLTAGGTQRLNKDLLPTVPAKHTLSGHRNKVNAISFHPIHSVLASASADATGTGIRGS